jgi:tRNA(fMet)-specific endonuclease VapC
LEVKKVILDTNAYTRFLAGGEDVLDTLSDTETVYMSIFVLGELYAGFYGGRKERQNKEILPHFLMSPR